MDDDSTTCCSLGDVLDPDFFRALGHSNRVTLLQELCSCECASVSELADCCDVDISVVSRHLSQLKEAGVVQSERDKQSVKYSVSVHELAELLRAMADAIENSSQSELQTEENDHD